MLRFSWLSALRTLFPFRYRTRTTSQRRRALRRPLLCAEALEDRVVPAGRLFAAGALPAPGGPSLIYELNPGTGAVLNSFAAPESAGLGAVGLAFDGTHLFYINGLGSDLLYELNPATGAVLDSDPITAGSGNYDGLAVVGGQVFIQDYALNRFHVFDPVSDTITRTVTPTAATFGPDLGGGLAGATGPDGLIGPVNGGNLIAEFNPTTGAFVSGFQPGTGPFLGAAVVDNVIYLGFGNSNAIRMYSRTGTALGQITIPVPVVALGGDGVSAPNTGVVNGGFETGTTAGWTVFNAPGSSTPGFTTYTGPNPQQSSLPAPPEGTFAAYNGHNGGGSYILYQDITLPADQSQTLSLTAFYQNQYAQGFITPATLDYRTGPNQQFRIDIISPTGDLLATTTDVVKLNVFRTAVGDPQSRGAFTVTADLGAFAGQTVRLRIAVVNNQFFLFGGVDNVRLTPSTPTTPGAVQGVKFNDLDGDGVRDPNEPGLQGWTIYADLNQNGRPDTGEPSAVTGPDGSYSLALTPGTYRIRELNQGGWAQTAPLTFPLYASGDNGSTLIAIDPVAGTATRVGPFGAPNTRAGAFTSDGTYWTIVNGLSPTQARLARVDLATGAATPVGGVLWTGSPIFALESVLDNVLFGFSNSGQIVRIDATTGAATVIGQTAPELTDVAFDSAKNLMWALQVGPNRLIRIDLSTGVVQSVVVIAGLDGTARGLMFQPRTRTFYVTSSAGTLYTLDPHTGQATKVGAGLGVPAPTGGDFGMVNWYTVTVGSGQTITARDFGDLLDVGTITGVKFEDLDGDGVRDPNEPGLSGFTIYADTNQNGQFDAGETTAVTGPDGSYTLSGVPAGSYDIREVVQPGWVQTGPTSGRLYVVRAKNGETPIIAELDEDGLMVNRFSGPAVTATAGPQGLADGGTSLFYIDDSAGPNRLLYELDPFTGAVRDSDPLLIPGVTGLGYLNGLVYLLTSSNQIVAFDPLTDTVVKTLQIPGPSFFGGLTGASGLGLLFATAGTTIYAIDPQTGAVVRTLNPNVGSLLGGLAYRSGELLAAPFNASGPAPVYRIDPQTGAVLGVLAAITEPVGALGGDGSVPGPYHISLSPGQILTGRDFGNRRDEGTITGVKFNDLNGDGVRAPDEPALPGWTIYIDANNNGQLDAGERSTVTGPDGSYALTLPSGLNTVREVPQAGWVQTSPTAGRLFVFRAAVGSAPTITELDASGVVLNSFSAPPLGGGPGSQGLADGGTSLFYADGSAGPPTLYELDPFTGAVRDSDPLLVGGGVSGLGYLNGLVYVLSGSNQITVFDPVIDSVVRTLQVPGPSFLGGLTGSGDLGLLFAVSGGTIYGIDPQTGAVVRVLNPNVGALLGGLAYRSGELLAAPFGSPASNPIYRINPQTGAVLGVFGTMGSIGGLGGDGPVPGPYRLRVTPGSVFAGRDFGNRLNAAPVAVNDTASVGEDNVLTVGAPGVLANDTDPDPGDARVVTAVNGDAAAVGQTITLPSGSQVRLDANGGYTFTPAAAFNGLRAGQSATDTFTYTVTDSAGNSATATVTVTITGANDAPTATPDSFTTDEDTAVAGNILANDTDPDIGDPLTVVTVNGSAAAVGQTITLASGARLTVAADGTFVYDPAGAWDRLPIGQTALDQFTYSMSDGFPPGSSSIVVITITGVNDAPVAADDAVATDEDTPVTVAVLPNDSDIDGDALTISAFTQGEHGTVELTPLGLVYTPATNYSGPDSFAYTISDGHGGTATATVSVTVNPVNDAPTAVADLATVTEDGGATPIDVLVNDTDVENDTLRVTAVTQGTNGTVTITGDGAGVSYTPAADFFGTDSFTYEISDGHGGTSTATVMVTVTPVNDAPTLAPVADLTLAEDAGAQAIDLTGITAGPGESQALTVTATSSNPGLIPNPTVAYISPSSTGTLTFAPATNASGSAVITVTVSDGTLTTTRQFTVTVTPVNDAPTTTGLPAVALLEDAATTDVPLTGGFADVEDGPSGLTYAVVGNTNAALFSTVTVVGGVLQLRPAVNTSGSATLTIRATDTGGQSVQTTLSVNVTPVNDAPSFVAGANQTVAAGAGARSVAGWATAISRGPADEANQTLTFVVTTNRPDLFVVPPAIDPATGTLTYIPDASATGTATVTVALKDSGGTANGGVDTFTRTFTITVNSNGLPTSPGARVVNGELLIIGGNGADTVTVTPQGNKVKVQGTLNGSHISQSFSGVTRVRVSVKGGNDVVTFASNLTLPTWTDAGVGDDTVTGGGGVDAIYLGAGDDTADGGAGNDFIAGGAGEDLIQGGAGNDTIYAGDDADFVIGGPGVDQLFGQGGNDILVGASAAVRNTRIDSLRKVLTDWNPTATGTGGYANIRGRLLITDDGSSGDQLTGGTGTDWFWALLPPDAIKDQESGEQRN